MKLELQIKLNNAAYHEYAEYPNEGPLIPEEVANNLESVANEIRNGKLSGNIHDYNGNNVGSWRINND